MKTIFKITSYIFHPLLMATWMLALLFYANPFSFSGGNPTIYFAIIFINTFFFPMLAIVLMRKLGFLDDIEMPNKTDRIIPLVATIVFYVWAFLSIKKTNFPTNYTWFLLGTLVSLMSCFLINIFHKISLHMVGISGVLMATFFSIYYAQNNTSYILIFILVVTGLVATARLYLEAHTTKEIISGVLVGVFGQLIAGILLPIFVQ